MRKPEDDLFLWKLSSIARACGWNIKTLKAKIARARVLLPRDGRRYRVPKNQIPDLIARLQRPVS